MISLYKTWNRYSVTSTSGTAGQQFANVLVNIKNLLVSSGKWTIISSCDSVAVGSGGGVNDKWVDYADLIFAASGNAHSWIVLQNAYVAASGTFQICIDLDNTSTYKCSLYCTSAGYNSDGTTTAKPTAVGSECAILSQNEMMNGPPLSCRVVALVSSDGECTRVFVIDPASNGGGCRPLIIDKLKSPPSWLTVPYIISWCPRSTGGYFSWLYSADTFPTFANYCSTTGGVACVYHNSTSVRTTFGAIGGGTSGPYLKHECGNLADYGSGSYTPHAIVAVSLDGTVPGVFGELYDIYWLPYLFGDGLATRGGYPGGAPVMYLPTNSSNLGLFAHGCWLFGGDGNGGFF